MKTEAIRPSRSNDITEDGGCASVHPNVFWEQIAVPLADGIISCLTELTLPRAVRMCDLQVEIEESETCK
jgi:hypothetical protein